MNNLCHSKELWKYLADKTHNFLIEMYRGACLKVQVVPHVGYAEHDMFS